MLKLPLKPTHFQRDRGHPWKACTPFVDNRRAVLIHRPYNVTTYRLHNKPHIGVHFWCGNSASGSDIFTFTDALDGKKLLCARCETAAVAAGLPSADELSGRHIHTGKIVAVQTCCAEGAA